MLYRLERLLRCPIAASDEEIGRFKDVYLDNHRGADLDFSRAYAAGPYRHYQQPAGGRPEQ